MSSARQRHAIKHQRRRKPDYQPPRDTWAPLQRIKDGPWVIAPPPGWFLSEFEVRRLRAGGVQLEEEAA